MNDGRQGESLWSEWLGEDYATFSSGNLVFFTFDHVDLELDIVRRALASALQREGVCDSLGDGYRAVDTAEVTHGHVGYLDEEDELHVCDDHGETYYGDEVSEVLEATWVAIDV